MTNIRVKTRITDMLGIEKPIIQAAMGKEAWGALRLALSKALTKGSPLESALKKCPALIHDLIAYMGQHWVAQHRGLWFVIPDDESFALIRQ